MKTLEALRILDRETDAQVYLVGGFVRDLVRKKYNNDLDVVVRNLQLERVKEILSRFGPVKEVTLSNTNDIFDVSILLFKGYNDDVEAQISLPRKGVEQKADYLNLLEDDVIHRDFTINAMYLPVKYISYKSVIDLAGGLKDIKRRTIVANGAPTKRIKESPIRMLRAISLASRTHYRIDGSLIEAMKKLSHLVTKVPPEAVQKELNKILLCKRPSKYLRLMHKTGLLKYIIPELEECIGVQQETMYHKYDVFNHCVFACDNIDPDLVLRLSTLLHDIGKPSTKSITDTGRITFHNHELEGAKMAYSIMTRLKYDNDTCTQVVHFVRMHMYHYTREFTDSAVRRFIIKAKVSESDLSDLPDFDLFKIRKADRLGNGFKKKPVTQRQEDFEERVAKVFRESTALHIKDLAIGGKEMIDVFNVKPGPIIGDTLKHLLVLVLKNPKLNEREELIKAASTHLFREKNKE